MLLRANQVRAKFNKANIQVSDDTMKLINDVVEREVQKMVVRCSEGNVKRLTPGLFYIALGNLVTPKD
jgi:hypothetical protein|tara:strand:- start:629 stop:832 length:204 start_codon:yes stop_codon:yes gene_type:complete